MTLRVVIEQTILIEKDGGLTRPPTAGSVAAKPRDPRPAVAGVADADDGAHLERFGQVSVFIAMLQP